MAKYAAAHPGKLGDALYTLPFMRYLYGQNGEHFDFYTSDFCAPIKELFLYQPYIDNFIVSDSYKVERTDMGCQPPHVPIPDGYSAAYQLGFTQIPTKAPHQYMAEQHSVTVGLGIRYEYPELPIIDWNGAPAVDLPNKLGHETKMHLPYVCVAPRNPSSYGQLFYDLTAKLRQQNIGVVQLGAEGEYVGVGRDATGASMLETLSILSRASGFVGLMSSQLVLANGFDIPRIAPHDGKSWDMRHVIQTQWNHYPINPTVDQVLALLKG